jgi:hypothetical protein
MIKFFLDKHYIQGFEMSDVSSGNSTHLQGHKKLVCWNIVLSLLFIRQEIK